MKDILGFNGDYKITENGDVWSYKKQKPIKLKKRFTHDGYVWYSLSLNGKAYTKRVSRLVAEAFIKNVDNKDTVNHIDGNKENNHVSNLEWMNKFEQMQHAYDLGLKKPSMGTSNGNSVLSKSEVLEIRGRYKGHCKVNGMKALADEFQVSHSTITKCVRRTTYNNIK